MADRNGTFRMRFDAETRSVAGRVRLSDAAYLLRELRPFRLRLALFLAAAVGSAWTFVRIPALLGEAIDLFAGVIFSSVIKGTPQIGSAELTDLLVRAAVLLASNAACSVCQGVLCSGICSAYAHCLRGRVAQQSLHMAAPCLYAGPLREAASMATDRIDEVNQSLNLLLSQGIAPAILLIAIFISLFRLYPPVALLFLLVFPLYTIFRRLLPVPAADGETEDLPPEELFRHLTELRLDGAAKAVTASFEASDAVRTKRLTGAGTAGFLLQHLPSLLLSIALALSMAVGVKFSPENGLTVGMLISAVFYTLKAERPLSQTVQIGSAAGTLVGALGLLREFLACPQEETASQTAPPPSESGDLRAEGISFRYPAGRQDVFRDFSARIPPVGVTVLTGDTGAGKTTLLLLLLRFYTPLSGRILYDGYDAAGMDLLQYRGMFSVIGQEATLFDATVADNISYPRTDAPPERLEAAVREAGAAELIASLPQGYDTFLVAGGSLSDGQIQQILLARALYHRKRLIVLDEATSFLDAEEEARFFRTLKEIARTRGVILISHKNTAVASADTIIRIGQEEPVPGQ